MINLKVRILAEWIDQPNHQSYWKTSSTVNSGFFEISIDAKLLNKHIADLFPNPTVRQISADFLKTKQKLNSDFVKSGILGKLLLYEFAIRDNSPDPARIQRGQEVLLKFSTIERQMELPLFALNLPMSSF